LDSVLCSNEANGLESKAYSTLDSLHSFPYVGGVYTVEGWNSVASGAQYAFAYGINTDQCSCGKFTKTRLTVSQAGMTTSTNN
ncbi:hypothetical protein BDN67DRAFT_859255, partial [Paxillus ammoniavirescens]